MFGAPCEPNVDGFPHCWCVQTAVTKRGRSPHAMAIDSTPSQPKHRCGCFLWLSCFFDVDSKPKLMFWWVFPYLSKPKQGEIALFFHTSKILRATKTSKKPNQIAPWEVPLVRLFHHVMTHSRYHWLISAPVCGSHEAEPSVPRTSARCSADPSAAGVSTLQFLMEAFQGKHLRYEGFWLNEGFSSHWAMFDQLVFFVRCRWMGYFIEWMGKIQQDFMENDSCIDHREENLRRSGNHWRKNNFGRRRSLANNKTKTSMQWIFSLYPLVMTNSLPTGKSPCY